MISTQLARDEKDSRRRGDPYANKVKIETGPGKYTYIDKPGESSSPAAINPISNPPTPPNNYMQQYESSLDKMRQAFATNLAQQRQQAIGDVSNLYASRGITGSGEEATALGKLGESFGAQAGQFEAGLANQYASMLQNQNQWQQQFGLQQQLAQPEINDYNQFTKLAQNLGTDPYTLQLFLTNPDIAAQLGIASTNPNGVTFKNAWYGR